MKYHTFENYSKSSEHANQKEMAMDLAEIGAGLEKCLQRNLCHNYSNLQVIVMVLIRIRLGQNQQQQNGQRQREDQQQQKQQRNHSNQQLHPLVINHPLLHNGMDQNQHKSQNHSLLKLQVLAKIILSL